MRRSVCTFLTALALATPAAGLASATPAAAAPATGGVAAARQQFTYCGSFVWITKGGSCPFARNIARAAVRHEEGQHFRVKSPVTKKSYDTVCTYQEDGFGCFSGKGHRQLVIVLW